MGCLRSIWRITLWISVSLVILVCVTVATVRVRRYVLRHRAEMLLVDMQSITLRQTTFGDVQPILLRWRRWGKYDGACSRTRCTFDISLSGFDTPLNQFLFDHMSFLDFATHLGEAPTEIRARFTVLDDVVWSKAIRFGIETPVWSSDGKRGADLVSGAAESVSKLDPNLWGQHWRLHPDYSIHGPDNMPNVVQLRFTPFAKPQEISRLMVLNFACLTRLVPCRTQNEIMPAAVAKVAEWSVLPDDPADDMGNQCEYETAIEISARDARNVVIAKVVANRLLSEIRLEPYYDLREYSTTLVVQQGLKGDIGRVSQMRLTLKEDVPRPTDPPSPGTSEIIFFKNDTFDQYSTSGCSPLSVTAPHLSWTRAGIAQDTRPSDLPD